MPASVVELSASKNPMATGTDVLAHTRHSSAEKGATRTWPFCFKAARTAIRNLQIRRLIKHQGRVQATRAMTIKVYGEALPNSYLNYACRVSLLQLHHQSVSNSIFLSSQTLQCAIHFQAFLLKQYTPHGFRQPTRIGQLVCESDAFSMHLSCRVDVA